VVQGERPNLTPVTRLTRLICAECGALSPPDAGGWEAYLDDDDQTVTFCPACAKRGFGAESVTTSE
jgi:hypothetical protein